MCQVDQGRLSRIQHLSWHRRRFDCVQRRNFVSCERWENWVKDINILKILNLRSKVAHAHLHRFSGSLDDARTSSSHSHYHYVTPRRSPGNSLKRKQSPIIVSTRGSRTSLKSLCEDEDTLRRLLDEWVTFSLSQLSFMMLLVSHVVTIVPLNVGWMIQFNIAT